MVKSNKPTGTGLYRERVPVDKGKLKRWAIRNKAMKSNGTIDFVLASKIAKTKRLVKILELIEISKGMIKARKVKQQFNKKNKYR